jgi:hypothetical protein
MKITGLDAITKKMEQLAKFAGELDGDVANVSFDPHDPASIDQAINEVNAAIDERAASYGRNDWVENAADQLKEQARSAILEKAAAARLGGADEE